MILQTLELIMDEYDMIQQFETAIRYSLIVCIGYLLKTGIKIVYTYIIYYIFSQPSRQYAVI